MKCICYGLYGCPENSKGDLNANENDSQLGSSKSLIDLDLDQVIARKAVAKVVGNRVEHAFQDGNNRSAGNPDENQVTPVGSPESRE